MSFVVVMLLTIAVMCPGSYAMGSLSVSPTVESQAVRIWEEDFNTY
jgi:hypothetical protein